MRFIDNISYLLVLGGGVHEEWVHIRQLLLYAQGAEQQGYVVGGGIGDGVRLPDQG